MDWRKFVLEVLINRLGGLNLHRKSVVRLTDSPVMTIDVYRGRKTTTQKKKTIIYQTVIIVFCVFLFHSSTASSIKSSMTFSIEKIIA